MIYIEEGIRKFKITKFEAVQSLVGFRGLSAIGDEITYHDGQTPPSNSEIDAEVIRLEKEYSDNEYARNRQAEYPLITDVTVALAEKMEGNGQMWDEITALRLDVKSRFPKPT